MPDLPDNHARAINTYSQATPALISVQVPFLVGDTESAISGLGGHAALKKFLRAEDNSTRLNLLSNVQDDYAPKQLSNSARTRSVLLKLSTPKRTGRKRKRGSLGPFYFESNGVHRTSSSEDIPQIMSSNPCQFRVEALGLVPEVHKFRRTVFDLLPSILELTNLELPDYGWALTEEGLAHEASDSLFTETYPELKRFKWTPILAESFSELLPPPTLLHQPIPYTYAYKQNPAVKRRIDESGQSRLINDSKATQLFTFNLEFDVHQIPSEPHEKVPPLEEQPDPVPELVVKARKLFEERPIWTRRALENTLPSKAWSHAARTAYQYLGYRFKSGPWRDAYIRFGVDPRKDPSLYKYQTIMLQLSEKEADTGIKARAPLARWENGVNSLVDSTPAKEKSPLTGHVFDGHTVNFDGKVWQICDITDPIIQPLRKNSNLRSECHIAVDGWYQNATWAKIRTLLKIRARDALAGLSNRTKEEFSALLAIPESITSLREWESRATVKAKTAEQAEWVVNVKNLVKQSIAKDSTTIRGESEGEDTHAEQSSDTERTEDDGVGE